MYGSSAALFFQVFHAVTRSNEGSV
jgi:hypothetical protein